jgi:hypothetical protein
MAKTKRQRFTPGMQCPGGCGTTLETTADLYRKRPMVLCETCGKAETARYMRQRYEARRATMAAKPQPAKKPRPNCESCGKSITPGAKLCRTCNSTKIARKVGKVLNGEVVPTPVPPKYTGLRGPGGEWEHGPEQQFYRPLNYR